MPRFEVTISSHWEGEADDEDEAIEQAIADVDDFDCTATEIEGDDDEEEEEEDDEDEEDDA